MTGYIKDHRKELDSDVWQMPPLYHRTWQWLKYNVNHSDKEIPMRDGSKMQIKRGQRLTSVRDIAKGIGWHEGRKWKEPNPKTVSAILEWMEKTGMISIERGKGNREYTLITLINYEVYNEKESQGNSKVTLDGEGGKQSADINKNEDNENNDKKLKKEIIYTSDFDQFWQSYPNLKRVGKPAAFKNWKRLIKKETPECLIACAMNYSSYVIAKEITDPTFIKQPNNFLNEKDEYYKQFETPVLIHSRGGGSGGKPKGSTQGFRPQRNTSKSGDVPEDWESLIEGARV